MLAPNTGTHIRPCGGKLETRRNENLPSNTCGETMRDKGIQDLGNAADTASNTGTHVGRQDLAKADASSNTGTHVANNGRRRETRADMGRQDLGIADTSSNKGKPEGRQWETRPRKAETTFNIGRENGRQAETRPRKGGYTIQRKETRTETIYEGNDQNAATSKEKYPRLKTKNL